MCSCWANSKGSLLTLLLIISLGPSGRDDGARARAGLWAKHLCICVFARPLCSNLSSAPPQHLSRVARLTAALTHTHKHTHTHTSAASRRCAGGFGLGAPPRVEARKSSLSWRPSGWLASPGPPPSCQHSPICLGHLLLLLLLLLFLQFACVAVRRRQFALRSFEQMPLVVQLAIARL